MVGVASVVFSLVVCLDMTDFSGKDLKPQSFGKAWRASG